MSGLPPEATELTRRSNSPLRANTRREQLQQIFANRIGNGGRR
jgi:hypothetical protein